MSHRGVYHVVCWLLGARDAPGAASPGCWWMEINISVPNLGCHGVATLKGFYQFYSYSPLYSIALNSCFLLKIYIYTSIYRILKQLVSRSHLCQGLQEDVAKAVATLKSEGKRVKTTIYSGKGLDFDGG